MAASKCNEFKKTITGQSKKTLLGAETSSLILSGGATVVGPVIIAKSLAAGAAATTGFGGLIDEGYTKNLKAALDDIKIGRTRIYKQILKGRNGTSAHSTPTTRHLPLSTSSPWSNGCLRANRRRLCDMEESRPPIVYHSGKADIHKRGG